MRVVHKVVVLGRCAAIYILWHNYELTLPEVETWRESKQHVDVKRSVTLLNFFRMNTRYVVEKNEQGVYGCRIRLQLVLLRL